MTTDGGSLIKTWMMLSGGILREITTCKGVGAGVNHLDLIPRHLEYLDMDFFLIAMPHTLLRQEMLDAEFPACVKRGIGLVMAARKGLAAIGRNEDLPIIDDWVKKHR